MNQDDFRRLLESRGAKRGGHGGGGARRGERNITSMDMDSIRKLSAKKSTNKAKHKASDDESNGSRAKVKHQQQKHSQYRDRAAERRQGGAGEMVDADEFAHLDAEQSKFLGGDMAHTHLVKGLDFALLTQLKREKEHLERATAAEKQRQNGTAPATDLNQINPVDDLDTATEPTFKSRMGRMVYFHACQQHQQPNLNNRELHKSEIFLPGRMYYTFNIKSKDFESIPVAVQRSKEDCAAVDEVITGMVDDLVIAKMQQAIEQKRSSKKMLRKRIHASAREADDPRGQEEPEEGRAEDDVDIAEPASNPPPDSEDEDIFPNAGDYVPIYRREDEKPRSSNHHGDGGGHHRGYFADLSASLTAAEKSERAKEEEAESAWKATLQKAVIAQAQIEREQQMKARAAKIAAELDSYSEYQEVIGYDSEGEDAEKSAKRKKQASTGKGGEVDDKEKSRRKKQKQCNKLQNDLEKINKIMASKS